MASNPAATSTLHPPRLASIFAVTPSAPGTPVHSIQTMRRKAAGHQGPLTKILVANRGVRRPIYFPWWYVFTHPPWRAPRKSPSVCSVLPTNSRCTPSLSFPLRIGSPHTVRRYIDPPPQHSVFRLTRSVLPRPCDPIGR